jgi:hypothetical protein
MPTESFTVSRVGGLGIIRIDPMRKQIAPGNVPPFASCTFVIEPDRSTWAPMADSPKISTPTG